MFCQKCCCGPRSGVISNIVVKLEKQESTTAVQGNEGPEAQFSQFCFPKSQKRLPLRPSCSESRGYTSFQRSSWGPLRASRANPLNVLKGILENHPQNSIQKWHRKCPQNSAHPRGEQKRFQKASSEKNAKNQQHPRGSETISSDRDGKKWLWSYACRCFSA